MVVSCASCAGALEPVAVSNAATNRRTCFACILATRLVSVPALLENLLLLLDAPQEAGQSLLDQPFLVKLRPPAISSGRRFHGRLAQGRRHGKVEDGTPGSAIACPQASAVSFNDRAAD